MSHAMSEGRTCVALERRDHGVRVWRVEVGGRVYRAHHKVRTGTWWVHGPRGHVLAWDGAVAQRVLARAEQADREFEMAEAGA